MKQRVFTAALLIPPVLLAVFLSDWWPLWILAIASLLVGQSEIRRLTHLSGYLPPVVGTMVLLLSLPVFGWTFYNSGRPVDWEHSSALQGFGLAIGQAAIVALSLIGVVAAFAIARREGRRNRAESFWLAECASLWLGAPFVSMILMKLPARPGPIFDWTTPILLCVVPIWVGDTLTIFAGKAFGKHLLAPKISPKKTIEGAIANLIGCLGASIGLAYLIHQPPIVGILAGLAAGTLGQLGDLLESAMKRSAGVKDSGNLLPGHGGLLDRIDSILLSAPAIALLVETLGNR